MRIKLRYMTESLLSYGLIFMIATWDLSLHEVRFFPVTDGEGMCVQLFQAVIFASVFPLIRYPVSMRIRAMVFGIGAGLLAGSFAGFEHQAVITIQFLTWTMSLHWFYMLYLARKNIGLVHLRVKDDKIGIVLPMESAKWFPTTKLTEASKYVRNSSLRSISGIRYDIIEDGQISPEQLRDFGNTLISKQPRFSA